MNLGEIGIEWRFKRHTTDQQHKRFLLVFLSQRIERVRVYLGVASNIQRVLSQ